MKKIKHLLSGIYKPEELTFIMKGIEKLWEKYRNLSATGNYKLSEKDVVLITYGDQVYKKGENKLRTLRRLLNKYLKNQVSIVHILPFYPYTSDDGFAVTDYYSVNPELGTWNQVEELAKDYKLIFDAVINHSSSQSEWFKGFLDGNNKYKQYYLEADVTKGYDKVVRPRTSPLTHSYVHKGQKHEVWTTFSDDQVDLNYKDPKLLLQILDLLLFYVSKGASILRLDAIGFMWKEMNTSCIHLAQTHKLVKLMRQVVEHLNSSILLLTETNVPHKDNISYFVDGDEAHMVYNFTLPPLLAFSLLNESTKKLSKWVSELIVPHKNVCYFNFLASHDGIGVMPVQNILNDRELDVLIDSAVANGGKISYKSINSSQKVPYEINCNYLNLLYGTEGNKELGLKRTMLAHSILLSMPGLPAIYFHSIFGSLNDITGMKNSGQNRRINREKFEYNYLNELLENTKSRQGIILEGIKKLIDLRKEESAFMPYGDFEEISPFNGVFAICRKWKNEKQSIYCYFNLTQKPQEVLLDKNQDYHDIISDKKYIDTLPLEPLGFVWLKKKI